MYGTTEELFFNNNEIGGAYWDKKNAVAQKSYKEFNPIEKITEWDTPILIIHGGKDYRVPEEQGFQALQQLNWEASKVSYFIFLMRTTGYYNLRMDSYGRERSSNG